MSPLLEHDLQILQNSGQIVGIDEAGRGALAGPVVAAAVSLEAAFYSSVWCIHASHEVNDSKQLSPAKRDMLFAQISQLKDRGELLYAVGIASVSEIEKLNILGATKLAMQRALQTLENQMGEGTIEKHAADAPLFDKKERQIDTENFHGVARVLIDGSPLKNFPFRHQAIVHGDGRSLAIAMASIIAKVTRDRIMDGLDIKLPLYGFAEHKGYATRRHRARIKEVGASTEHRPSFLKKLYAGEAPAVEFVFTPQDKIS
jgi:ribonuclease HII